MNTPPATPPAVRPVAEIDQELAALTAKIAPGEKAREKAKKTLATLEEQRRSVLIAARVDQDPKAAKQLDGLTPKVEHAALGVRDSEAVLEEIHRRIKGLRGDRRVGVRDELQVARARSAKKQLALSREQLDPKMREVLVLAGEWCRYAMEQSQISADLNEPLSRTPAQQLAWVVNEYFRMIAPMHFDKPALHGATFTLLAERFADPAEKKKMEQAS